MKPELILEKAKEIVIKLAKDTEEDKEFNPIVKDFLANLEGILTRRNSFNYLLLPDTKEHPELITSLTRLAYGPEVQKVAEKLDLNLENNEQGYVGNINFNQAEQIALGLEGLMETPSLFIEKLRILKSGKGYDAQGNKHDPKRLERAFNEITEAKEPWRSQWLNHSYSQKDNQIKVTYHKFVNGKLEQVTEPLDEDTLMHDKLPGISLDDYIENPTSQGLPRKSVKEGSLMYWHPREGRVAWFHADAGRADLYCDGGPRYSDSGGGVAVAKIFHKK